MVIGLGADHGGYELKNSVIDYLEKKGHKIKDFGVNTQDSVDYPDIAKMVCDGVNNKQVELGMLFCGTGIGISIAANKIDGIRCGLIYDEFSAQKARQHNNCNVIAMGGKTMEKEKVFKMLEAFLLAEFEGDRHIRRLNKIHELEK